MALDPAEWFIIVPNMLGNGLSSSPSNTPPPYDRARFPRVNVRDNVESQYRLVTEHFGIERLALVLGWSMGAGQTYQWAVSHPEMVSRALPFCGSSRTSPHNIVFLEGVKGALTADGAFPAAGTTSSRSPGCGPRRGSTRAGASPRRSTGTRCGARWATRRSRTSSSGSGRASSSTAATPTTCSACSTPGSRATSGTTPGFDGDLGKALGSIRARAIVMPAEKDLYFPPEDEQWAAQFIPNAELRVIPGVWGHFAGGGANPVDTAFIDGAVRELLTTEV